MYIDGPLPSNEQSAADLINIKLENMGQRPLIVIPKNVQIEDISKYFPGVK